MEEAKEEMKPETANVLPVHEKMAALVKESGFSKSLAIMIGEQGRIDIVTVNMSPAERLGYARIIEMSIESDWNLRRGK